MKGIYLTEEGKKEIEAKIIESSIINLELEKVEKHIRDKYWEWNYLTNSTKQKSYQEILSSATILPVEDNWDEIRLLDIIDSSGTGNLTKAKYPNGVIIKPIIKTKYAD
jgi:hypothetical protein